MKRKHLVLHNLDLSVRKVQKAEASALKLTSGVSWTLVVDRLARRGPFPRHGEQVLILADLMRSCGARERGRK